MDDIDTTQGAEIIKPPSLRDERGRYLPGITQPTAKPITSANARSLALARADKYRKAAARGILKEAMSIDPSVVTSFDAWGVLNGRAYVEAMDKPRADLLEQIGRNIGATLRQDERIAGGDSPALVLNTEGALMIGKLLDTIRTIEERRDGNS